VPERSADWMRQAKRDLEAARNMLENGLFEWACFAAQQAAEKAVKAVLQKLNAVAWGHSVFDLLRALSGRFQVEEELLDCAKILDRYYVPTRYPNSFERGSPYEYYTQKEAEGALLCSGRIVRYCEGLLA
jgi:HEPN domain-containing protein